MTEATPDNNKAATSSDAKTARRKPSATKGRRGSRYGAAQQIYSMLLNPRPVQELVLVALGSDHLRGADRSYLQTLIHGVDEQREELDKELASVVDRGLDQLDVMEHAVLLVGCYELIHELTLPAKVIINESVELAKTFGATDGHRYVNGVLDKLARRLRAAEYGAG